MNTALCGMIVSRYLRMETQCAVWQVRGRLPKGRQQITFPKTDVACRARGYLPLNHVERGRLIVVFEAPGSRYGVDAEVVRSGELIDAITMYALKVEPSQFK